MPVDSNACISALHHVNVLTANLAKMRLFYRDVLGLEDGYRPPFEIDGAWLYNNGTPIVHLVDRPDAVTMPEGRVEHYALSGGNYDVFVQVLEKHDVSYKVLDIPDTTLQSVNLTDPDGNHIEVLFDTSQPTSV